MLWVSCYNETVLLVYSIMGIGEMPTTHKWTSWYITFTSLKHLSIIIKISIEKYHRSNLVPNYP
jgi:hypothetical protein